MTKKGKIIPTGIITDTGIKSIELEAVIYRACKVCGLSNPAPHNPHGLPNEPWIICPSCGTVGVHEDKGIIASWHNNIFKRIGNYLKSGRWL